LAVTDWRLRRWCLWFLALVTATLRTTKNQAALSLPFIGKVFVLAPLRANDKKHKRKKCSLNVYRIFDEAITHLRFLSKEITVECCENVEKQSITRGKGRPFERLAAFAKGYLKKLKMWHSVIRHP